MAEHTKGPWAVDDAEGESYCGIFDTNGAPLAYLAEPRGASAMPLPSDAGGENFNAAEHRANAHLMAAAPAMFEALKRLQSFALNIVAADDQEGCDAIEQANAALVAAEDPEAIQADRESGHLIPPPRAAAP